MPHFSHSAFGAFSIPSEIVRDPRLKPNERLFLLVLCLFADKKGFCQHGLPSIQEVCGISPGNSGVSITGLEALGWISFESGKAKRRPNQYSIKVPMEGLPLWKGAAWSYGRATIKKMTRAEWATRSASIYEKVSSDCDAARAKRAAAAGERPSYSTMDDEQLLEEVARESLAGVQHVPQEYLDNYGIVREGDNSEAVRRARVFGGSPSDYE